MRLITILIPAYNEEAVLSVLVERLKKVTTPIPEYRFEYLFVNDGSTDRTLEILKGMSVFHQEISYINLSRNFGKEIAMLAGFDHVRGDAVIILDADLQDPPELIPQMIQYWEQGYDDVFARRRSRAGETWFKKWSSESYYNLLKKVSAVPVQSNTGDFRLLDRKCIEALNQMRETQRYTKAMFSWIGYNKKEILFDRAPRAAGTTKWNYPKLFNLAVDGITASTIAPLRISSFLGLAVSLCAFLYMLFILVRTLLFNDSIPGYPSLMAVILFLGGIQLLSLGIIGEYLGRVFQETKGRPVYLVQEYYSRPHTNKYQKNKSVIQLNRKSLPKKSNDF
ncbi:glycosyltransferase involved in cell wall biosynthesis [Planomicrobium soli]|uniref:Glycosyltransferase involved in cell wall biosynthesis n=1 Tax=Planomicrobium soli TaxID=1176648 RepID=A0A2P8H5B6_9BACL|nr:glycosyltransferase family 2 protein [Planomicrobium soli]PSL41384.1 glycosyltransferase involved in cell wall biosynthesis [Planomicrobium soli]